MREHRRCRRKGWPGMRRGRACLRPGGGAPALPPVCFFVLRAVRFQRWPAGRRRRVSIMEFRPINHLHFLAIFRACKLYPFHDATETNPWSMSINKVQYVVFYWKTCYTLALSYVYHLRTGFNVCSRKSTGYPANRQQPPLNKKIPLKFHFKALQGDFLVNSAC